MIIANETFEKLYRGIEIPPTTAGRRNYGTISIPALQRNASFSQRSQIHEQGKSLLQSHLIFPLLFFKSHHFQRADPFQQREF